MKKTLIICLLLLISIAISGVTQEVRFGKNKVRYKDFDWKYVQTRHFDIYFYENAYPTAKFAATVMEAAYEEIVEELNYRITRRVPVFVYNSHNDFQQTNITPTLLPEGVGGFTEAIKNRIVIPFTGSYEDFRHVLHHELTHAVTFDMLYGHNLSSILSSRRLFAMPLWLAEGFAEYSSRHGWDYQADMFVRDATINNYLTPPQFLGGFLAYKQGQAMIKYIADKYGEKKLGELFQKGKIHLTMNKALKAALGIDEKKLWEDFSKEMKRRYWPEIARRKEANEIGKQLTHAREDGSYFNEKPAFSPEGDNIAIFTDKSDYTEIVLISAADGKRTKRLVQAQRSGDLESLHSYVSGMSFSPDGRNIVFVAKSQGKDALFFLDISRNKVYLKRRFDFHNLLSPQWSPDGKKIAFSALDRHKRDLYIYHLETDEVEQITDDRFDDVDPTWLPNSAEIVFSSDRPHHENPVIDHVGHPYVAPEAFHPGDFEYGTYNLFHIETAGLRIEPVNVGPGSNTNPKISPDGEKIAFLSNRNGVDNIYVAYLDSVKFFAVTDILTGVRGISWSPDGSQLAFSSFHKGAFDIFILKDIVPVGDDGVLVSTDYILGKYDLLDPSKKGRIAMRRAAEEESDQPTPDNDTTTTELTEAAEEPVSDELAEIIDALTADVAEGTTSDSLLAVVPEETTGDEASDKPSTTTVEDSTITETGVYDDEYVYISDEDTSMLDSLFIDIPDDDYYYSASYEEPAEFDSIAPLQPDGEYQVMNYKVKFTPDYVGGGFAYDTFFGLRGQSYFIFSDYLGNHQIYVATDLVNSIDQSYVQAFYLNYQHRVSMGGGFFHSKNFYIDNSNFLFSDRFYGLQAFATRPFSTFSRLDLTASQYFIDRKYYDRPLDTRPNRSSKATTINLAWVFDNVLWGYTGPVNGKRSKVTLNSGVNLFDSRDIEFYSAEFDYRKYWHFKKTVSMALRLSGGASFGRTPKQYFLGGTTNWIGNRTLDAKVFDVENLYFSDVVTPLRGEEYYSLSGDRYGLVNWELRFPMIQYFAMKYPLPIILSNIMGAIFTDVGAAWTGTDFKGGTGENDQNRLRDIKTGFGIGMRMNLFGFALLRYDIAWSTDMRTVSDKPRHYFSFGADF